MCSPYRHELVRVPGTECTIPHCDILLTAMPEASDAASAHG